MDFLGDIFNLMNEDKKEEEKRKKQDLEEEMEVYGLDDYEKELVRNGEYDPSDFDTDGPFEDDDYYNDDMDYDD